MFTAAAVLQLVQEKKLKLSDHITQIIDLDGTEISPNVTIEQLLNHTSGTHDDAEEEAAMVAEPCHYEAPVRRHHGFEYDIGKCPKMLFIAEYFKALACEARVLYARPCGCRLEPDVRGKSF